ncbi:hypothetical protein D046_1088B, partial [Vibrio parahaemolyticus V-223/04]
FQKARI